MTLLSDLTRAKATFQARTLETILTEGRDMTDPTKWIAIALTVTAASAASGVTVLDIGIDTGRRILGFAEDVQIVRWEVPDAEPMFAADLGGGRVSFFRGGEEQCLDKMLGAVPCDEDLAWPKADAADPAYAAASIAPHLAPPSGSASVTPAPSPAPPVPPVVPPPAPVNAPASWILALSAIAALVGWRISGKGAKHG